MVDLVQRLDSWVCSPQTRPILQRKRRHLPSDKKTTFDASISNLHTPSCIKPGSTVAVAFQCILYVTVFKSNCSTYTVYSLFQKKNKRFRGYSNPRKHWNIHIDWVAFLSLNQPCNIWIRSMGFPSQKKWKKHIFTSKRSEFPRPIFLFRRPRSAIASNPNSGLARCEFTAGLAVKTMPLGDRQMMKRSKRFSSCHTCGNILEDFIVM